MNNNNLLNLGLNQRYINEASMYDSNLYIARVAVQYKDMYKVITEEGEILAKVSGKLSYSSNSIFDYPVVGDWVLLDRINNKNGDAIIHNILSRKSYFSRKAAGNRYDKQIVASNIDYVFICMSLNNDFNINRLERYIAVAWDSMATPVIILTKSDLCEDINDKVKQIEEIAIGIDIIVTSSINEDGYYEVKKYIKSGITIAFIGSSGVGKSTLINKIINKEVLKTNSISENDKGRHTTTHRELFAIESGGVIIDTPGMRELGLISADVDKSFSNIEELEKQCKFSDCTHKNEPKCAVREAIENGTLDLERLERYRKLKREEEYNLSKSKQQERQKLKSMFGSKVEEKRKKYN
ncbi:MAG: ribosome small subunit-dependent GTPase A [Clostridium sp.]|uniref:ribosome small subunit-dependent GTPase A n=1 Tax=Clostridium sp. TaxID=1506 RepID=UPI001EBC17CB|nr:ribosome small subunit-dependent GTPase A [Clostridium sp.]MBS5885625.1 ribosome small subunit-dependent GTPase A [Clostridium sp.]MDU7149555.1 ribosome small subunit-dependent GTPase A [Clostridium sp.]